MTTAGRAVDGKQLVKDLQRQVLLLEDDLRVRAGEEPEFATALRAEYDDAYEKKRTAATYESWLDARVTQVAAAWVLGTVFVRFCEDNGLIERPFISGPGERLKDAEEHHEAYNRKFTGHNDRDWLIAAFDHIADAHPTAAGLFDKRHNPLWEITPSYEAATSLLKFWRRPDEELRYDFTDSEWDTRFLGDLYQDLSEHARKTFALLQTPEFVEEFILDLTLEPAVREFGLKGLRTIDPACGSGHFLLGIFKRLLAKWRHAEPGTDDWELIKRSLESVHGCDKNPFAVSIARFRLLVVALRATGETRLAAAPTFPVNVAAGDSLMHGRGAPGVQGEFFPSDKPHTYATEDVDEFINSCDFLGRASYHVVAGNPPYITVKDKRENQNYRDGYDACSGAFALSVPFAQRLFQLAIRRDGNDRNAGFVGQITANSFMKREFGKKLIESFFKTVNLTHVIDTSGAYIPGHGTPTVILVGRNHQYRQNDPIRAILSVRGEPRQPENPAKGLTWSAIVEQLDQPGSESDWISVEDIERSTLSSHPWSLSGGGASELFTKIESAAKRKFVENIRLTGRTAHTGSDEVYFTPIKSWRRQGVRSDHFIPLVEGDVVRDWHLTAATEALFPYDSDLKADLSDRPMAHHLWLHRFHLRERREPGGTHEEIGLTWYEWSRWHPERFSIAMGIAFAFVATHNHFVLDRGGKVFKQSAPVIKLPERASEDDHLALLALLNSSTACFWLKQVSQGKGGSGLGRGHQDEEWEERYEFTSTKLQDFPLPRELPLEFGRTMDSLAQHLAAQAPGALSGHEVPSRARRDATRREHERVRSRMIALQEELDWHTYRLYELLMGGDLARVTAADRDDVPEIHLGERAFEIVLARKAAAGKIETAWFERHGSTPVTEMPARWPEWYRAIVQARIDIIEQRRDIALIERPECKRRWATQPWEKKEAEALETWLLDRCERRDLWYSLRDGFEQPRVLTISQLADAFKDDADMQSVAQLYATDHLDKRDLTLAQVLEKIIADEHVPFLPAMRYRDLGLRKRAQWEKVWEQQREEDKTGERLDIPVPPKYTSADFRKISYWSQRGKLDVPKERFISYPEASPDGDPTLLLGWAGWDHKDQAQALVNVINDRTQEAGWEAERLKPLLAGLAEVMPWVKQWHGEYDAEWGGVPADEYQAFLDEQLTKHQLAIKDLTAWRPEASRRGRRSSAKGDQQ
ncbi:BREX-2 system adenine-specific DNA-methyltransferase PglX [Amycolatopsis sp. A133]|uniref:BREX-2 system adenine-specific DNA-methyltransferase PglX n=1 Tax=Amycolatopsis sp. A133 TaxID=3064472 RepID=UPI0027FA1281|nr:BREX-2 system adenine-specific DNA-methyltransferase PglX [Amycolatopsis sp. A133]MDQ7809057.1 BREX-2 system adenine-specific DNA-methyltransferase PglX [Amycolatopsis sp. A133]